MSMSVSMTMPRARGLQRLGSSRRGNRRLGTDGFPAPSGAGAESRSTRASRREDGQGRREWELATALGAVAQLSSTGVGEDGGAHAAGFDDVHAGLGGPVA